EEHSDQRLHHPGEAASSADQYDERKHPKRQDYVEDFVFCDHIEFGSAVVAFDLLYDHWLRLRLATIEDPRPLNASFCWVRDRLLTLNKYELQTSRAFERVSLHLRHAINCVVEPFSQQDVAVTRFVIGGAVLEPFFNQRVGQEPVTQLGGFKRGLISL